MWSPGLHGHSWIRWPAAHLYTSIIITGWLVPVLVSGALHHEPGPDNNGGSRTEVNFKLLPAEAAQPKLSDIGIKTDYGPAKNTSKLQHQQQDDEVSVILSEQADQWKTRVIIGCTVLAAVEILIVLFIIAYWREIRWHLRKLSCPCDNYTRSGHEALERRGHTASIDTQSDDLEVIDIIGHGNEVHTYSIRLEYDNRPEEEQALETSSV